MTKPQNDAAARYLRAAKSLQTSLDNNRFDTKFGDNGKIEYIFDANIFVFHAYIFGVHSRLVPCLQHALEVAYMSGALDALALGMGYADDDIRTRCLALQRQAAERLGELQESRDDFGKHSALNSANRTVRRRNKQRDQHDKRYR